MPFGDFIVYVDESGDHGLASIDRDYPVFVLSFCIFRKDEYATEVIPAVSRFKFEWFGHDQVVLHEADIRKKRGSFVFLNERGHNDRFQAGLSRIIETAPFTLVAVVIRKERLVNRYSLPANPYHLALEYGLQRVCGFLEDQGQAGQLTHFVFERRGAREDMELELEFRRLGGPGSTTCRSIPVEIVMADKKTISTGLQLADLTARPIGLRILRPGQPNRAYEILKRKFRTNRAGKVDGWGLKCFP